ncbi:MAG: hypothetical protein JW730_18130 [Anaerolineales bacterium]|nr:hypothetical protein [Anaerolineales bacterium]
MSTTATIRRRTAIEIVQKAAEVVVHRIISLSQLICFIVLTPRMQNRMQKTAIQAVRNLYAPISPTPEMNWNENEFDEAVGLQETGVGTSDETQPGTSQFAYEQIKSPRRNTSFTHGQTTYFLVAKKLSQQELLFARREISKNAIRHVQAVRSR